MALSEEPCDDQDRRQEAVRAISRSTAVTHAHRQIKWQPNDHRASMAHGRSRSGSQSMSDGRARGEGYRQPRSYSAETVNLAEAYCRCRTSGLQRGSQKATGDRPATSQERGPVSPERPWYERPPLTTLLSENSKERRIGPQAITGADHPPHESNKCRIRSMNALIADWRFRENCRCSYASAPIFSSGGVLDCRRFAALCLTEPCSTGPEVSAVRWAPGWRALAHIQ